MSQVQLFRFTEADLVWTLTSSTDDEFFNGEYYVSSTIGRSDSEVKGEMSRASMEIKIPIDSELAIRNLRSVVEAQVGLTVFSKNTETDAVRTEWKGRLASLKPSVADLILVFESVFTSMRRPGLRRRYQRTCPHTHYGRGCRLIKDDFAANGVVNNASGINVVIPAAALKPDGYYKGGMIEGPDGVLRFIISHVGQNLTLIRPLDSLNSAFSAHGYGKAYGYAFGDLTARIFPGCDRTKETCNDKFNNLPNNGSFPWIPLKNPVGGSSIV